MTPFIAIITGPFFYLDKDFGHSKNNDKVIDVCRSCSSYNADGDDIGDGGGEGM